LCIAVSHDVSCLLFTKLIYLNSSGRLQFHTFPTSHLAISKPKIPQASNPLPLKSILLLLSSSSQIHPSQTTKPRLTPPAKVLEILAVHPSHHRKGLGSLLIKAGLDLADRDHARTYIEASAKGLPLYLRHGWEPVGATVVDMRKYGKEAVVSETTLIRLPKTVRE